VAQLLARDARERQRQRPILRIGEQQRERRGRGLLLAVGVIEQQVWPAAAADADSTA